VTGGALDGIVVISLEQAVAAPYCSSRLADAGARVIKIERAEGDFARRYDADVNGQSAYFVWLNRGKESVCLDIKAPDDLALLLALVDGADVFVQNLLPGAAARAGIGSDVLRARNPRLITCDISGYGESGPYADMKAYDLLVQAESGLASITGTPDGPARVGVSVSDIGTGMYAYAAILEALFERERTGRGRAISVSLFDAMADWMNVPYLQYAYAGKAPRRIGLHHSTIAPYGAYACRDGSIVIAVQNEREWATFCAEILGDPSLAADRRFATNVRRVEHREELDAVVGAALARLDHAALIAKLRTAAIAFGNVNDVAGLARHPQLRTVSVETESGTVALIAPPARTSETERALGRVPELGEHTDAVRREFLVRNANA
jgi:crotonobetainyl-CoA:carnitine CoA-transferase CaiB-like acyl-CoA transferase